ncbi:hypothetical protein [Saccharopolyspora taberi]|uniref:Uncharacterized protein n=1 Tax=Saccharopolyspora taberi TaxID=60895 RepID=A0ABN3V501_9PSEU
MRKAPEAIAEVVHEAVVLMRTMAFRREALCDVDFPGTDYQEQIRLLADLCDTLVPGLKPGTNAAAALQYTWDTRTDAQRRWIRAALAKRGVTLEDLNPPASPV